MKTIKDSSYSPTKPEIDQIVARWEVRNFSYDFLSDLSCSFAGELGKSEVEMQEELKSLPLSILPNEKGYYVSLRRTFNNLYEAQEYWVENKLRDLLKLRDFILSLDGDSFPGKSPLEKAVLFLKKYEQNTYPISDSNDSPVQLPIFVEQGGSSLENLKEDILQDLQVNKELDDQDRELLEANSLETSFINMDYLSRSIFSVEQRLRKESLLNVKPSSKIVKDREGTINIPRSSRGLEDFSRTPKTSLIKRKRLGSELIKGEIRIPVLYKKEDTTPFITMILDKSGSMRSNNKSLKGFGILWFIIKQVMKGNCQALFAFFEEDCYEFFHFTKELDLISEFKHLLKTSFDGGDTEVGKCALQALDTFEKLVKEKNLKVDLDQKHLILVNDGQDSIRDFCLASLKGSVLHSFILDSSNSELKEISLASGGQYLEKL